MKFPLSVVFTVLVLLTFNVSALANYDNDSLSVLSTPHFDSFRVADNIALPVSRKVYVNDVSADFSSRWKIKFNTKTTKKYRAKVLHDYSNALKQHIKNKLTEFGWQAIDTPEEGVLVVNASLKDLFIEGPQKLNREHVLVSRIGQTTIAVIVEGADSNLILEIVDRQNIHGADEYFIEADNAINYSRFNRVMERWAGKLAAYIDIIATEQSAI